MTNILTKKQKIIIKTRKERWPRLGAATLVRQEYDYILQLMFIQLQFLPKVSVYDQYGKIIAMTYCVTTAVSRAGGIYNMIRVAYSFSFHVYGSFRLTGTLGFSICLRVVYSSKLFESFSFLGFQYHSQRFIQKPRRF